MPTLSPFRASSRVLLVEDHPADARLVREMFASQGIRDVVHADRLAAAASNLDDGPFDLALVDLGLPDSAGLETFRQLRAKAPDLPVVVVTGEEDGDLPRRAMREGAQDFLVKGAFDGTRLLDAARFAVARQQVVERQRRLDRLAAQLVASTSHELKTPLSILQEVVGLVRDGVAGPVTEHQAEFLEVALRNCERVQSLLAGLRDLDGDDERFRIRPHRQRVDALLGHARDGVARACARKGIALDIDLPPAVSPVLCDADAIQQVFAALLHNAMRHTSAGGRIVLRARMAGEVVRLEVEDTGTGVPAERQEEIFRARLRSGSSHLGLALCQHVVERHGGRMSLKSEAGRGSTFSLTLPLYDVSAELERFVENSAADDDTTLVLLRLARAGAAEASAVLGPVCVLAEDALRSRLRGGLFQTEERRLAFTVAGTEDECLAALSGLRRTIDSHLGADAALEFSVVAVPAGVSPAQLLRAAEAQYAPLVPPRSGPRVLVIDDDPGVAAAVRRALLASPLGAEVKTSLSGYEACLLFGSFEPDVVLLDVHMPEVNGLEVLRTMRKHPRAAHTRFIVVSGDPDGISDMMELGASDFLAKPFAEDEIVAKVALV